ncbi:uncharacterized protein LOC131620199 [Vicia villosa]|uniref:uncharacterized protein LOC131620199 n=1 Tax=Vicia villosa TaxID=3911 RepID=UPI00273CD388|nr:uncharacterized protein LOC131620199 [Vicia villosa]
MLPKIKEANSIGHFRPIVMENFKYKLVSKILADRLFAILPSIISPEQKGFIVGRNIRDGICLTSKAINLLGNKSFSGNVGYFMCSNGVRQGDPLSPLLFCLVEDVLSRGITNLDYAKFSGKICNLTKSIIYARGMSLDRHCRLADIIGFTKASPPFIYLGVPIFIGKPKANHFNFLADNIKLKLATWKANLLSMVGRVMLVKTMIHSMMVHCITIYNWPASIIKSIDKWMRNFFWSGNLEKKKLVTVAWKKCCLKKTGEGLGIISLKHYNSATNIHL